MRGKGHGEVDFGRDGVLDWQDKTAFPIILFITPIVLQENGKFPPDDQGAGIHVQFHRMRIMVKEQPFLLVVELSPESGGGAVNRRRGADIIRMRQPCRPCQLAGDRMASGVDRDFHGCRAVRLSGKFFPQGHGPGSGLPSALEFIGAIVFFRETGGGRDGLRVLRCQIPVCVPVRQKKSQVADRHLAIGIRQGDGDLRRPGSGGQYRQQQNGPR